MCDKSDMKLAPFAQLEAAYVKAAVKEEVEEGKMVTSREVLKNFNLDVEEAVHGG